MMQRLALVILLILTAGLALNIRGGRANDTSIALQGGVIRLVNEKHVSLLAERLVFSYVPPAQKKQACQRDQGSCPPGWSCDEKAGMCRAMARWQADLSYTLKNDGPARQLTVGLPFALPPCAGDYEFHGPDSCQEIEGFQTWVDDRLVRVQRLDQEVQAGDIAFNRIYTVVVPFKKGQTRVLRHRYISYDIQSVAGNEYRYLLRTGNTWKGPIGQVEISFEAPPDNGPCVVANLPFKRRGPWLDIKLRNWKPDRDLRINFASRQRALMFTGLWAYEDTPEAVCQEAMSLLPEEKLKLAAQVELLYGAPPPLHPELRQQGPLELCRNADYFAMIANKAPEYVPHDGLAGLAYLPDAAFPANMPVPLRQCLDRLRQP